MSKTSQANKLAKEEAKKPRKASSKVEDTVAEVKSETVTPETTTPTEEVETVKKAAKTRSPKYLAAKKLVDVNKFYPLKEAIELVKKVSLSSFDGKIEAHLTVTEIGNLGEITFPHLELGAKKIAIVNEAILAEIKDGKINFDILIATPVTMPKLLPFARTLGPKGLMPNPKSGTLTDKPEEAMKKLSVAKTMVKTEKKAPVAHLVVGKVSQPVAEIASNISELIKVVKSLKIKKLVLCPTMGPSVKVLVEKEIK